MEINSYYGQLFIQNCSMILPQTIKAYLIMHTIPLRHIVKAVFESITADMMH